VLIRIGRKSGPFGTAIVILSLVFVLGGWIWAGTHAPAPEIAAMHARCRHLPLLIGVPAAGDSAGVHHREAMYLCLPDYLLQPLQFRVVSHGDAVAQVVTSRTWGPYIFVGVLAAMGAFVLWARRARPGP
jgi:hypothetical protein